MKKAKIIFSACAVCIFGASANLFGQAKTPSVEITRETDPRYPPVVSATLKNGLQVLVLERKLSPTVSFNVFFRVGDAQCPPDKAGLPHLIEHMMFKGTENIGTNDYAKENPVLDKIETAVAALYAEMAKGSSADGEKIKKLNEELKSLQTLAQPFVVKNELFTIYQRLGADVVNAGTSDDYTDYIVSLPANQFEAWMILESERLKKPIFREFYAEKDVVVQEFRMRMSEPNNLAWYSLMRHAFTVHPYRYAVLGWEDNYKFLKRADLEDFFGKYYGPGNMVVSIVGDVSAEKIIGLMDKYFGN
ncbi:MAG: pitrilysin family protein, partial [Elusimicrobia bacterium]|nr:pitrilysin family protein [Elusimicrobiota bacterium]